MSTKKEVRAALKGKAGVDCFVRDSSDKHWMVAVVEEVTTEEFGYIDGRGEGFKYCIIMTEGVVQGLVNTKILKDASKNQLTPLQKALAEGREVLCWVSDSDEIPEIGENHDLIHAYESEDQYPFSGSCEWKYATPISKEYFID